VESALKIIAGIFVLGAIIAAMTAQPKIDVTIEERALSTHSDIFFTYTTVRYPSNVEIVVPSTGNFTIGVNVDTDKIDFGVIEESGGSVKRQINLTTKDGKNSRIHAKALGSIAPMLTFDRNDFTFNGMGIVYVTFDSGSYPAGIYTGEVDIVVQRSNSDILRYIVGY
jgi:hypothetical protein